MNYDTLGEFKCGKERRKDFYDPFTGGCQVNASIKIPALEPDEKPKTDVEKIMESLREQSLIMEYLEQLIDDLRKKQPILSDDCIRLRNKLISLNEIKHLLNQVCE